MISTSTRRTAVVTLAGAAALVAVLSACGDDNDKTPTSPSTMSSQMSPAPMSQTPMSPPMSQTPMSPPMSSQMAPMSPTMAPPATSEMMTPPGAMTDENGPAMTGH